MPSCTWQSDSASAILANVTGDQFSKGAAWKFKLRAGVAELQQKAERQASGQSPVFSLLPILD